MALWTYSDYITIEDDSAQLIRLRLHIQEVSNRILAVDTRAGDVTAVPEGYLDKLIQKEEKLKNIATKSSFGRNSFKFGC